MIKLILFLVSISLFASAKSEGPNFSTTENGCLIYTNLADRKETQVFGENCSVRSPPCSTFKIALAEIAFKNKKIDVKGEYFKWDGKKRDRDALNKDQDLRSWMRDSVVWVSSLIVDRVTRDRIQLQLSELKYGNALVGLEEFWIKGPLAISVEEQIQYLSRQSQNENLLKALQLLPIERIGSFEVSGKTGSCFLGGSKNSSEIGWFVGTAKSPRGNYALALRFINIKGQETNGPAGLRAKTLFLEWISR